MNTPSLWLRESNATPHPNFNINRDIPVVDMVIWDSAAQAKEAAGRLMTELANSPVHGVIDQRTVSWTVGDIFHEKP